MVRLFDTHAHLHDDSFTLDAKKAIADAKKAGVDRIITVGTDARLSRAAVELASRHRNVWAAVGLHPHDSKKFEADAPGLEKLLHADKVVAVGECGLDYYYMNSPKPQQKEALSSQLAWAEATGLPVILHMRSSEDGRDSPFADLWEIWDSFNGLTGVVHSFTAGIEELDAAVSRGLFIALNGIMTFSKNPVHAEVMRRIPLDNLLIESDAPFLTPVPFRGKINEPKYVESTARHIAKVRGVEYQKLAFKTSANAEKLFLN